MFEGTPARIPKEEDALAKRPVTFAFVAQYSQKIGDSLQPNAPRARSIRPLGQSLGSSGQTSARHVQPCGMNVPYRVRTVRKMGRSMQNNGRQGQARMGVVHTFVHHVQ